MLYYVDDTGCGYGYGYQCPGYDYDNTLSQFYSGYPGFGFGRAPGFGFGRFPVFGFGRSPFFGFGRRFPFY